jgi:voltage-gated potassium channel
MAPQTRLERFERITEWPLAAFAVLFLVLYSIEVLAEPRGAVATAVSYGLRATYLVFVADYLARLYLAEPRLKWFVRHLHHLALVALPFLRPLRLLSLAVVIESLQRAVGHSVRGRIIVYTVCGAVTIVYAAALAMLETERHVPGAKITDFPDALWWAITTVTTVGYGDLTPVSDQGRLVAAALMVGGISLLGVVTATLASWIIEQVSIEDAAHEAVTVAHIEQLRDEIRRLAESVTQETAPAYGEVPDGGKVRGSG